MAERYLTGFQQDDQVVLLYRDAGGTLRQRRTRAEHVSYHKTAEIGPHARSLRSARAVRSFQEEGEWTRIIWADWEARRKVCSMDPDTPLARAGVGHYEADVSPLRRLIVDKGIKIARPRRAYFDIETDSRVAFSEKEKMRIVCWTVVDGDTATVYTGVLEVDTDAAERALLEQLWVLLQGYDQLLAWYGDGFDYVVLEARSRLLLKREQVDRDMRRLLLLDHLVLFKRMNMNASESGDEKQSMRLQDVGMATVGEGKDDFDASKTWQAWAAGGDERARMVRYNQQDTLLLRKIEEKTGFVDVFQALCEACHVFPHSGSLKPMHQVDSFMLRLGLEHGVHFATRWHDADEEDDRFKKFAGAYVMEPAKGIQRNVHVGDFKSMYPNIIVTWNMSPETKKYVAPGALPPATCRAPSTGIAFRTDVKGMLPLAVEKMMSLRDSWKKQKATHPPGTPEHQEANRRSMAYKVAANSFYGVVGSPFSRFYDREVSESITQQGVWLIQRVIEKAERKGMTARYADSITGDRTVVLRSPAGMVEILPIEEFWASRSVARARGKEFVETPGWAALAMDAQGKQGWFPLKGAVRHRVSKPLWLVSNKRGQTQVTADHGIMMTADKAVGPEEFIRAGAPFVKLRAPKDGSLARLDLWECLADFQLSSPYKGRIVQRGFRADRDGVAFLGWGAPRGSLRRHYDAGSEEMGALLRLVGAYISEGSASIKGVTADRSMLSIAQNDRAWLERLQRDLQIVAPGNASTILPVGGDMWALRSGTTMLPVFFAALCGFKSSGKRLPGFVYRLCRADFEVMWRKLVEGDGHVYSATGQMSYTTKSQVLAAGMSFALDQHDVEHRIEYRADKACWSIGTRPAGSERVRRKTNVEVREADREWVYDLTVEGAHTFVDGIGRVLLHNTDSLFITGASREEFGAFIKEVNAVHLPQMVAETGAPINVNSIAYEKAFDILVFSGKKRYAGNYVHYDGKDATADSKPEVKGLEYKRGDTTRIARAMQYLVIQGILAGGDGLQPATHEPVLDNYLKAVLEGVLVVEDVRVSKTLSKNLNDYVIRTKTDGGDFAPLPHIAVARELLSRNAVATVRSHREVADQATGKRRKEAFNDVPAGTRIEYVVADASTAPLRAIPAADYDGENCDRYYLWENLVWPPTMRLLESAFPAHDWSRFKKVRPRKARKKKAAKGEGQLVLPLAAATRVAVTQPPDLPPSFDEDPF